MSSDSMDFDFSDVDFTNAGTTNAGTTNEGVPEAQSMDSDPTDIEFSNAFDEIFNNIVYPSFNNIPTNFHTSVPTKMNLKNICKKDTIVGDFFHGLTEQEIVTIDELSSLVCDSNHFYTIKNTYVGSEPTYILFMLFDTYNQVKFNEFKTVLKNQLKRQICRNQISEQYINYSKDNASFILYISSIDGTDCDTDRILIASKKKFVINHFNRDVTYYDIICSKKKEYTREEVNPITGFLTIVQDKWNIGQIGQMLAWNLTKTEYVIIEASTTILYDYYINKCDYTYGYPEFKNPRLSFTLNNSGTVQTKHIGNSNLIDNNLFREFVTLNELFSYRFTNANIQFAFLAKDTQFLTDLDATFREYIENNYNSDYRKLYNSYNSTFLCYKNLTNDRYLLNDKIIENFKKYYKATR